MNENPGTDFAVSAKKNPRGLKRRLISSFIVQSLSISLRIIQQLLLVPILLLVWGRDLYQDWLIIFSATGLLGFLDLGLQIYFGNALLISWSKQETSSYRRHAAIGLFLYTVVIATAIAALFSISCFVSWPSILGIRIMDAGSVLWTAGLLAAGALIMLPLGIITSVYRARGDNAISISTMVFAEALRGLGVGGVALFGGSPVAAAWVYLAIGILSWIAICLDQRNRYGEFPCMIVIPTWSELATAISQSGLYMVPTLSTPLTVNVPIMLIGMLGPTPGAVVTFTIARTYTGLLRQAIAQLAHAVGIELGRAFAVSDMSMAGRLFKEGGRMVSGVAGLFAGMSIVAAEPFIGMWTRQQVDCDPLLIAILAFTIVLMSPAQLGYMIFHYSNKPRALVIANGGYAATTIVLCILLIAKFSDVGAAISVGISEILFIGIFLLTAACSQILLPIGSYLTYSYPIALASFGVSYAISIALSKVLSLHTLPQFITFIVLWVISVGLPAIFLIIGPDLRAWLLHDVVGRLVHAVVLRIKGG